MVACSEEKLEVMQKRIQLQTTVERIFLYQIKGMSGKNRMYGDRTVAACYVSLFGA